MALTSSRIRAYDHQSLLQLCEAAGLSDEAIELMAITSGEEDASHTAATETLREEFEEVWSQGFDEVVGGTDRLASAFAGTACARARGKARSCTRISQDASGVAAEYRIGARDERIAADYLGLHAALPGADSGRLRARPVGPEGTRHPAPQLRLVDQGAGGDRARASGSRRRHLRRRHVHRTSDRFDVLPVRQRRREGSARVGIAGR
jgi:hypothetical protein